ncbi:hypothetical protein BU26DRAFT_201664 [Trematosphaeria pertusa]|uniref:Uncharacterized protein n=1 Tax=Trematosphaeria pertusa TaxID=390896 RepID=A0A6A6HRV0_9PLEO|nr:uncharacterized protein BU26DRAFT_201664 [Trematosphaeria pertusa]KAF2240885.1 hypothetical protein BU26DRAFT_201664 [Trematosphaeria pertusa]
MGISGGNWRPTLRSLFSLPRNNCADCIIGSIFFPAYKYQSLSFVLLLFLTAHPTSTSLKPRVGDTWCLVSRSQLVRGVEDAPKDAKQPCDGAAWR